MERGRGILRHIPAPERREGVVEREELGRREREHEERPGTIVREEPPRVREERTRRPAWTDEDDAWYNNNNNNNPEPRERRQQPNDSRDTYPSVSRHVVREDVDEGARDFDGPAGGERRRSVGRLPGIDATPVYLMDHTGEKYVFPLSKCGSKEVCVVLGLEMFPEN